jgi:hypothetical protein
VALDPERVAAAEVLVVDDHLRLAVGSYPADQPADEGRVVLSPDAELGDREGLAAGVGAVEAAQGGEVGVAEVDVGGDPVDEAEAGEVLAGRIPYGW